jgi:DNA-binding NtrC family response regulator
MQIGVEISRALENKRVFVIDSDEISRAALQFMLHDENETHELSSLDEAYRKGLDGKPDLVLLGMAIVGERGPGVIGEIAGQFPGARILLVADGPQSLPPGAHGLLTKPLTVEKVRDKVDILLGRKTPVIVPLQVLTMKPKG